MTDKNQQAILAHSPILSDSGDTPCLDVFLADARANSGEDVQGLAFATNGTWPVLGFNNCSSAKMPKLSVTPIDGRDFDPTKIFELRLWVPVKLPDETAEDDILAHEFRWVNGVGAVELMLIASTAKASSEGSESGKPCVSGWVHKVSYLQHKSAATSKEEFASDTGTDQTKQGKQYPTTNDMSALEFIQEEDNYGNTVVVDQLFTGRWN